MSARILVVDDLAPNLHLLEVKLQAEYYDVVTAKSGYKADGFDGLRVCASLRFNEASRDTPILVVGDPEDEQRLIRAYDIGINDTLMRPIELQEMHARVATLLRRKFYADSLRENFNENLEMVVADPLTGLGNRRYFDRAIDPFFGALEESGTEFSIMVFDIDHFKRVNDILGHDMGDQILKEVATRLVTNMRAIDVVSRYGGEEFMIAMPKTSEGEDYDKCGCGAGGAWRAIARCI